MLNGGGGDVVAEARRLRNQYLETVQSIDLSLLSADEVGEGIKLVHSTGELNSLQEVRWVGEFDSRQAFVALGEHSTIDWLRSNTHVSGAAADKQVTLARQLDTMQPTLDRVEDGSISVESFQVIARQLGDLPEGAQAELLEAASSPKGGPQQLRRLGDAIRHRDDPEGWSRSALRQHEKRNLGVFNHADGMVEIEGSLPGPEGHKFRLCLESLVGIPPKGDKRTQEQRNADALIELCVRQIASGKLPKQGGRAPQLTVIVQTDGGARLDGYGPISPGTLKRLRDQDHVERAQVVDGCGVTLNFGRARRVGSEPQRQEVGTRYSHCVVGVCTVPIRDCELHHVEAWKDGGGTDVGNEVPLCRFSHHPLVTEGGCLLRAGPGGIFELVPALGANYLDVQDEEQNRVQGV